MAIRGFFILSDTISSMSEIYFNQPPMSRYVRIILIAIVSVFVLDTVVRQATQIHISALLGFSPERFFKNYFLWQIFTYPFLHGGLTHLFFNGLVLYTLGSQLEYRWGSKKFLNYFFWTSTGGAILHSLMWALALMFFPDKADSLGRIPVVGASGGLYGLFVAFGMLYGESRVHVFFVFPLKAKHFVMLLLGTELFSSVFYTDSGVAHLVHLGGLFAGYLLLKWKGPNLDRQSGGGGWGSGRKKQMSQQEIRSRLKLIVNKDQEQQGKYPPTWN